MKTITGLVVVLLATLPCRAQQAGPKPESKDQTSDYYPLEAGSKRHYQVQLANGRKVVLLIQVARFEDLDGKRVARVETVVNGEVRGIEHVGVNGEGVFRYRIGEDTISPPACLMKYPVKEGETWKAEVKLGDMPVTLNVKTGKKEEVQVPLGKYQAISVTTEMTTSGSTVRITSWFAPKVGLIKQSVERKSGQVNMELFQVETGK